MNQIVEAESLPAEHYSTNIKLSLKQRFDYAFSEFGYNAIYFWVSAFMIIYYTDVIGVSAAAVSLLTLVVRVFDAFNDPFIGSLADRSNSKWGKYKPWVAIGATFMSILVVLLFMANPNWSNGGKLAYMWIVYVLLTVASTCCNMPFGALNGVLTSDSNERNKIAGLRMVFANAGGQFASIVAVPLIILIAGTSTGSAAAPGYFGAVLICVILGLPTLIYSSVKVKEVVKQPPAQKKIPLGKQFACFFKNRYALCSAMGFFMTGFTAYGRMAMLMYYFTYFANNPALMTVVGFLGLGAGLIGCGFLTPFFYKLFRHKGKAMILGYALGAIFAVPLFFLTPTNIFFWICMFLSQLFQSAAGGISYGIVGDAVDYGEYKTGVRVDGFLASFCSLMLKAGGAVGPAIMLAVINGLGYVPNETQNPAVLTALRASISLVVTACCLLAVIVFAFYNMDEKKHAEIRAEIDRRHEQQRQELSA
jgi:sugar (glycoside-pentoside-hexuronide) transporter